MQSKCNLLKIIFCFIFIYWINIHGVFCQQKISIIPHPVSLKFLDAVFSLTPNTKIVINKNDSEVINIAGYLNTQLFNSTGNRLNIVYNQSNKKDQSWIVFKRETKSNLPKEGYKLNITDKQAEIVFHASNGAFYAVQTLLQLLPPAIYNKKHSLALPIEIPCIQVVDSPRYQYRGMHLDVGRHYFSVGFIMKYIDLLALHKMNTFHWHLTEDQGWRIEIKKYPKLTGVGSLRKESMIGFYDAHQFDGIPYGGYYTQEEIKDVVQYAASRYITVIPEIEMPGHSRAALSAYPELGCTPGPVEVATEWGVFNEVFCPTEKTFSFLEDVLSEVCVLFPGKYIHIGGDECPKVNWRSSDYCQQLIKKEHLRDEMELQSYFIRRIEKFLLTKEKKLIGWDEILEGGLAPEATVMSWRGIEGGISAARQNHDVIMTPGSHCYFDHYQSDPATEPLAIGGYTTIQKVYAYEPTPFDSLTTEQQKHILGAQGNVWTEYITDTKQLEYMAFPRACALAEVLWTNNENRNWINFSDRLLQHFDRLDALDVNYAKSIFDVTSKIAADTINKNLMVSLQSYISDGNIRYSTDSSLPTEKAKLYSEPFAISDNTTINAKLFSGSYSGKIHTKELRVHKATAMPYMLTETWKQYDGSTLYGLTDGVNGILNRYNTWVGFSGKDLEAIIDFQKPIIVNKISVNFYNKNRSWIFLPVYVSFAVSDDGINYQSICKTEQLTDTLVNSITNINTTLVNTSFRYLKVFAKNIGKCPLGHPGEGQDAWLFADEIVVE